MTSLSSLISLPGRSPGRAIVLPQALAAALAINSKKFNVKVFYVIRKALSCELSCLCDRSCSECNKVKYGSDDGSQYM